MNNRTFAIIKPDAVKNKYTGKIYNHILESGFKICLVSPELQNQEYSMIKEHKKIIDKIDIDAVCTKKPELWK